MNNKSQKIVLVTSGQPSLNPRLVKEADTLDQILLLREYAWAGNKEAEMWLHGKGGDKEATQLSKLKTDIGKELGKAIYEVAPSDWWNNLWTSKNR